MTTIAHFEEEKIREDIELLKQTLQGTEDEFSPDDDDEEDDDISETGLVMDVEEGSIPAYSFGHQSNATGTETPLTIFSEDDVASQYSQGKSISLASTSQSRDYSEYAPSVVTGDAVYDPETCLALNRAYQELVSDNLLRIEMLLADNRQRQVAIHEEMDTATRQAKEPQTTKKFILSNYAIPYFKDASGACPQKNIDVQLKRDSEEPELPKNRHRQYTISDKKKLIKAVQADNLQRWLRPLMNRLEIKQEKLIYVRDPDEETAIKDQIKDIEREMEKIKSLSPLELAGSIEDADHIDWMKISTMNFEGRNTNHLLQAWKNSIHPAINWNKWTKEEDNKLAKIVERKNAVDWEQIAKELNTSRTAFQCIQRYQQKLNPNLFDNRPWTEEDNKRLSELVKNAEKVGDSVANWSHIAMHMEGRKEKQCFAQYQKIDPNARFGRWTDEEDQKLLAGVRMYGPKWWCKLASNVPGRTGVQCRERWHNVLSMNLKMGDWTYEEDRAIILNYQKYKGKWTKIAEFLPGRTDHQVLMRYRKMEKWRELEHQEDALFRKTGVKGGVIATGGRGKKKKVEMKVEPRCEDLSETAQKILDLHLEDPNEWEMIEKDRQNNIFIPRPPTSIVKYGILKRTFDRRRKVSDMLSDFFTDADKKPPKQQPDQVVNAMTLKKYIEKRKEVLDPELIKKLREVIVTGQPMRIKDIMKLSRALKNNMRKKTCLTAMNVRVEEDIIKEIKQQAPRNNKRGRPKKIWAETLKNPDDEEEVRSKISVLLMKAFCLDPVQLLRRAMFNRPGAVPRELLDVLRKSLPAGSSAAAEVVEIDSAAEDDGAGSEVTVRAQNKEGDVRQSVDTVGDPGSVPREGSEGSREETVKTVGENVTEKKSSLSEGTSSRSPQSRSRSPQSRSRSPQSRSKSSEAVSEDGGKDVEDASRNTEGSGDSTRPRSLSGRSRRRGRGASSDGETLGADVSSETPRTSQESGRRISCRKRSRSKSGTSPKNASGGGDADGVLTGDVGSGEGVTPRKRRRRSRRWADNRDVESTAASNIISKELNIHRPILVDKNLERKYPELLRRIRSPPLKQPSLFVKNEAPLRKEPGAYNIPPLPPTTTTLSAFRSLLLERRWLLQMMKDFQEEERRRVMGRRDEDRGEDGQSVDGETDGQSVVGETVQNLVGKVEDLGTGGDGDGQVSGQNLAGSGSQPVCAKEEIVCVSLAKACGDPDPQQKGESVVGSWGSERLERREMNQVADDMPEVELEESKCAYIQQHHGDFNPNNPPQMEITSKLGNGNETEAGVLKTGTSQVVDMGPEDEYVVVFEANAMGPGDEGVNAARWSENGFVNTNDDSVSISQVHVDGEPGCSEVNDVANSRNQSSYNCGRENGGKTAAVNDATTNDGNNAASYGTEEHGVTNIVENSIKTAQITKEKLLTHPISSTSGFHVIPLRPVVTENSEAEPQPGCSTDDVDGRRDAAAGSNTTNKESDPEPEIDLKELVSDLRNTHDYQLLRARFMSLFIWPALLSATEVPEISRQPTVHFLTKYRGCPMKGKNIIVSAGGEVRHKRKRYACTQGKRSRRFKFLKKEKKQQKMAMAIEKGRVLSERIRARKSGLVQCKDEEEDEEGCAEFAAETEDGNMEDGDEGRMDGDREMVDGDEEMVDGDEEMMDGDEEMVDGDEEMVDGD